MKAKIPFFTVLSLLFLAGCKKADAPLSGETPQAEFASMEVRVLLCSDALCSSTTSIKGARILAYAYEEYQTQGSHVVYDQTTGEDGRAFFGNLQQPEYWLTIQLPDGRSENRHEYTPAPATTLVDVRFGEQ